MVKKLRYYARYIVVCLLLNKMDLVKVLVKVWMSTYLSEVTVELAGQLYTTLWKQVKVLPCCWSTGVSSSEQDQGCCFLSLHFSSMCDIGSDQKERNFNRMTRRKKCFVL